MRNCAVSIFIVLLVLSSALPYANAHPHVFVDAHISLVFDENGLAGFIQEWTFDEMFGEFILEDYDKNKNRIFEELEVAAIKGEAFDNLKSSGYFQHILLGDKPFEVKWITDFAVRLEKNRIVYTFMIPCHIKITDTSKTISLSLSDPTIYTDLAFTSDTPLILANPANFVVLHSLVNEEQASGQFFSQTLKISVKRK